MKIEWILCPFCGSKTLLKIRYDTVLENFPLYCPKCKNPDYGKKTKFINHPRARRTDAQTIIRKVNSLVIIGSFLFQYTMRACPAQRGKKKTQLGRLILCAYFAYLGGGFEKSEPPFLCVYTNL